MRWALVLVAACGAGGDDGDCVEALFYPDGDGDGFGDAASPGELVCPGPGFVVDHTDCADGDPAALPGQTTPGATAIIGPAALHWDFNCDGAETRTLVTPSVCRTDPVAGQSRSVCLASPEGWFGAIPACGASGEWAGSCSYNSAASPACFETVLTTKSQLCL